MFAADLHRCGHKWSRWKIPWAAGERVCDFENVKRYNVIMEERESSMARVVGLL